MEYKDIKNFQDKMRRIAKNKGLYEDFGQKEITQLKAKFGYNPYGNGAERENVKHIDSLNDWCMTYTGD